MTGEDLNLDSLVPDDIFVGTSSIIRRGDRFLYGIRPAKEVVGLKVYELTGIGGGLEKEDSSYSAGLIREAQEEIGCDIRLLAAPETLVVYGRDDVQRFILSGEERPAAVIFRYYRTPAHQPWHPQNQGSACLIVFLAELAGEPQPLLEMPNLIWLTPEQVLESARRDVSLQELISSGADLIAGPIEEPPGSGRLRMTDSQEALALALGDQTPDVYRSFGK